MEALNIEHSPMGITKELSESGELVIKVVGDMDAQGCKVLKPIIQNMFNDLEGDSVVLNLFDVSFLDSSGIGAIVFMFKRLKADNKHFEITGVHGQPKEILKLLRVDKVISIKTMNVNV